MVHVDRGRVSGASGTDGDGGRAAKSKLTEIGNSIGIDLA